MRDLKGVLESEHGLDLTGWQLMSTVDISDDGLVIAGNGINPLGQSEGWVVRLEAIPEPATLVLFVVGACGIVMWRRPTWKGLHAHGSGGQQGSGLGQ
jgi:hypothetical protein